LLLLIALNRRLDHWYNTYQWR